MTYTQAVRDVPYAQAVKEFKRRYLAELLQATNHNVSEAARRTGLDRWTLYRHLYKYGVQVERGERRCA